MFIPGNIIEVFVVSAVSFSLLTQELETLQITLQVIQNDNLVRAAINIALKYVPATL